MCKENMARRFAKRRCTKYGGNAAKIQPSMAPLWVYKCDPRSQIYRLYAAQQVLPKSHLREVFTFIGVHSRYYATVVKESLEGLGLASL